MNIPKRFKFARVATVVFFVLSLLALTYTYLSSQEIIALYESSEEFPKAVFPSTSNTETILGVISEGNIYDIFVSQTHGLFYFISISGVLCWGIMLRAKDELKLISTMVATSLLVTVYLVEIVIHFIDPSPMLYRDNHRLVAKMKGVKFDQRTRYQVTQDLRHERGQMNVVSVVEPVQFVSNKGLGGMEPLFPLAGMSKKMTVARNETGEYMIYWSDRYGFNNPDPEWNLPQVEWALIGDSFAHGYSVNPQENIAAQIRLITGGESVINLGMAGSSPLIELGSLKEYAEFKKPKKVIWFYTEDNDLFGNYSLAQEKLVPLLKSYLQPEFSQRLIHRQIEIDDRIGKHLRRAESHSNSIKINSKTLLAQDKRTLFKWKTRILRLYNLRLHTIPNDSEESNLADIDPLFAEILTKAKSRVQGWGGKLYFVYLPTFPRYDRAKLDHELFMKRNEVIRIVKNLDLSVIDIHEAVFASHPNPRSLFPFSIRGHYSAYGYSEVAKAIVSFIKN